MNNAFSKTEHIRSYTLYMIVGTGLKVEIALLKDYGSAVIDQFWIR